jgi:hypothetical protein
MNFESQARAERAGGIDAELIRVEAGGCSGPRRSGRGPALLVVVDGVGQALAGDAWIEVGPGDRVEVEEGEPCALRSTAGEVVGVLVRAGAESALAA